MKKILLTVSAVACAFTAILAVSCEKKEKVTYQFDTLCEEVSVADVKVTKGEEFTLPEPSARGQEWEFAGWYLSSDFSGAPVTTIVADMGTTYYAKWEQLYKLTLNLNGGTLANNDGFLYLKAGERVATYLTNYVPTKTGYEFGQWLNGTSPLGASYRMPASALSISARYKVGYTIDVYKQTIECAKGETTDEYDKETLTFYEYAQSDFEVEYSMQGFSEIAHDGTVVEGDIKENPQAGDNSFVMYFDRECYTVKLNSNNPALTEQQENVYQYYYGELFELPYELYTSVGYIFAGWSKSATGKNDYPIDFIDAVLYNKEQGDDSEVTRLADYIVTGDETLYAYWNKGYSDLFGGADTVFHLNENSDAIYLFRGSKYFKGEYNKSNSEFIFYDKQGENSVLEGKILPDNMFVYSNDSRANIKGVPLYSMGDGIKEEITLSLGYFNEVTYTETNRDNVAYRTYGSYTLDEETGEFIVSFDSCETGASGELVGKTLHVMLMSIGSNGSYKRVFLIRDEEEYAIGTLPRLGLSSATSIGSYPLPNYSITLDGYGFATYYNGSNPTQYLYYFDEQANAYLLLTTSGNKFNYIRIVEEGGYKGYMFYFSEFDDTFVNEDPNENDTLTLDGMIHATYVSGTTVARGMYTLSSSYFGGYILTFTSGGTVYTFRLNVHYEGTSLEDLKRIYTIERKPAGYIEYYYYDGTKNSQGADAFYYPMLVLNDEQEGVASFYQNVDGGLTKVAWGPYQQDEKTGLYALTITGRAEGVTDFSGGKYNLSKVSALVFALDNYTASNRVYYTYSHTDLTTGEVKAFTTEYTPSREDQEGSSLTIVGGFAIYAARNEETTVVGTYSIDDGVMTITTSSGYLIVEIDEENHTFVRYDSAPFTAYLYREDGTRTRYETMEFDGKGGVTYKYSTTVDGEAKEFVFVGTSEEVGTTDGGYRIYLFTGVEETENAEKQSISFRYIFTTDNYYLYFIKISDKEGTFTSSFGTLELDGTGNMAQFTDTFGNTYRSLYRARTDTVVYMYANGEYLYFELDTENNTFSRLGSELGTYILMDNQIIDGRLVECDGKGGAAIYRMSDDEEAEDSRELVASGTYVENEDGTLTVNYTVDGVHATLTGRVGTLQIGDYYYSTFSIQYDSIANTYVNEADYSVLILNDAGNAIRFTQNGGVELGTYTLITDEFNIIYYVNSTGSYATIYAYNTDTKLISVVENSRVAYFNQSFTSLMFTEYGFAIFNGTDRYYYYDDGSDIYIYRIKTDNVAGEANKFGFVEEKLEEGFKETITYGGVTYYKNNGFNIIFSRTAENAGKYPAPGNDAKYELTELSISPSGATEFSVAGTLKANKVSEEGKKEEISLTCTVTRRKLDKEESEYETFIMLGNYRFDVELVYSPTKAECVYEITKMRFYVDADSALYYQNLQMYAMYYGEATAAQIVPFFGHITIWSDYDEEGNEGDMFMSGTFSDIMQFFDVNGETISFEKQPCELTGNNFTVTVTHTDGYTYKGVFQISTNSYYGVLAYSMVAFYREQTLTSGNYQVTLGRVITSENQNYAPGRLITLSLADASEDEPVAVEADSILNIGGSWHVIVRTYDENKKITSAVYYKIELTEMSDGVANNDLVAPYESATVSIIENITTVYAEDGQTFVEINETNHTVMMFYRKLYGTYIVSTTEYNATDDSYLVTTTGGAKFVISFKTVEGKKTAVITKYVDPEEV